MDTKILPVHFTMKSSDRIACIVDEGSFKETSETLDSVNALDFKDYKQKVEKYPRIIGPFRNGYESANEIICGRQFVRFCGF